jgi:hypothetical protein
MKAVSMLFSGMLALATVAAMSSPAMAAKHGSGHKAKWPVAMHKGLFGGHEGFHGGHFDGGNLYRGHEGFRDGHFGHGSRFYGYGGRPFHSGHDRDDWDHHHYYRPIFHEQGYVYTEPSCIYVTPPTYYVEPPVYVAPGPVYDVSPPAYYEGSGFSLGVHVNICH